MQEKVKHYFALYKPYGYLCQFTGEENDLLLGDLYDFPCDVYSVGRLDKDSEGLLLLTNDNQFKNKVLDPKNKYPKTYWVQVEGEINDQAINHLEAGTISIQHKGKQHKVDRAVAKIIHPEVPERTPPIRFRKNIPTSWIELTITEGKNRQVRKMTAAAGYPTLRLIRVQIGHYSLQNMKEGEVLKISPINR